MSQLTFGDVENLKDKAEETPSSSWYKGRVLSHSSIALFQQCPQRWKFKYVDKTPEKPKSFFSFGKSVHSGLEYLFSNPKDIPTLPTLLDFFKEHWISEGYDSTQQENWFFKEGERIIKGFYAKHSGDAKKILQVELRFKVEIEGVPILGFIDRIDRAASGGLAIIDYKTGKPFDRARVKSDSQLTMYQLAVEQSLGEKVDTLTLYHLNSLTPISTPKHSSQAEDELKKKIVSAAQGIMAETFEPNLDVKGHCHWCDYQQICPAYSDKKSLSGFKAKKAIDLSDNVDRAGKLDDRIKELILEKESLLNELKTQMNAQGSRLAEGKHYNVELDEKDQPAVKLREKSNEVPY